MKYKNTLALVSDCKKTRRKMD